MIDVSEVSEVSYSGSCSSSSTTQVQSGSNKITLNTLSDGIYSDCSIQLTDAAGNQSTPYALDSFEIDSNPPNLNLTTVIAGLLNDSTPSLVFSSSELGTIAYAGACSNAKTSAVAGENEITLNNLNDGTYPDCELKVTDAAGNTSALALDSFTVDTLAPSVTITSQILSLTRDTTPSFVIDVSEASAVAYSGSCSSGTTQVQSGGNEITFNALSDGTYSDCSIQLTDAIGNQGSLYPLGTFRIDTIPPSLNLTTPALVL